MQSARHPEVVDPVEPMLKAVAHHADQKWIVLYVERWLKAPMQRSDRTKIPRVKGTSVRVPKWVMIPACRNCLISARTRLSVTRRRSSVTSNP